MMSLQQQFMQLPQGSAKCAFGNRGDSQAPSTPGVPPPLSSTGSPELTPLCPRPQRAFPSPTERVEQQGSPSSPWPAVESDEFRELFTAGAAAASKTNNAVDRGTDSRLSAVSTSAGPTPGPDERPSPQQGAQAARMKSVREGASTPVNSQIRKVFVGGVPQDLAQDDLYNIFIAYGQVKKAWLQRYKTSGNNHPAPPHNHRGFGFVIFYDSKSVDDILGDAFSKFVKLPDGRKLEVKRAVSSTEINEPKQASPKQNKAQLAGSDGPVAEKPMFPLPLPPFGGSASLPIVDRSVTPNPPQQQQQPHPPQQQFAMMAVAAAPCQGGQQGGFAAMSPPPQHHQQAPQQLPQQQQQQQQQMAFGTMQMMVNGVPQMQAAASGRISPQPAVAMTPVSPEQQSQWIAAMANGMQPVIAAIPSGQPMQQQFALAQAMGAMGGQMPWPQGVAPNGGAMYGMLPMRSQTPQPQPMMFASPNAPTYAGAHGNGCVGRLDV